MATVFFLFRGTAGGVWLWDGVRDRQRNRRNQRPGRTDRRTEERCLAGWHCLSDCIPFPPFPSLLHPHRCLCPLSILPHPLSPVFSLSGLGIRIASLGAPPPDLSLLLSSGLCFPFFFFFLLLVPPALIDESPQKTHPPFMIIPHPQAIAATIPSGLSVLVPSQQPQSALFNSATLPTPHSHSLSSQPGSHSLSTKKQGTKSPIVAYSVLEHGDKDTVRGSATVGVPTAVARSMLLQALQFWYRVPIKVTHPPHHSDLPPSFFSVNRSH